MTTEEKAKILLQHGSYEKYIFLLLDKNELGPGTPVIQDMISEELFDMVDAADVAEELKNHEDPDVKSEDIDECMFDTWEEVWDFYREDVVEKIVSIILEAIKIDINDIDLSREVYKIVESEAEDIIF